MSKRIQNVPYNLNNCKLLRNRELGLKRDLGYGDEVAKKIYTNIDANKCRQPFSKHTTDQGGIFNLDFSPDGGLLVAACEQKSILLFDASNQKPIRKIRDAHSNCVNCVRFINDHTFATCSDDNTIKMWDTRWLRKAVRTLQGHSNWVKNIEYSEKERVMVTSAFDGSIYAWDLNSPTENNLLFDKVFVMNGLMRTRLSPDGSKMIVCTTTGYIIIIHDLNLATLQSDIRNFRPNLYRLMQLSEQTFPAATMFNYLFYQDRKSNRLEFIDDFPNDAEVISSLQIHPMGWSALSRNVNAEENDEWTCVHDIQARDPKDYEDAFVHIDEPAVPEDLERPEDGSVLRPSDIWMGVTANEQLSVQRMHRLPNETLQNTLQSSLTIINSGILTPSTFNRYFTRCPEDRYRIVKNLPRLTHFIKERNVGKGYIKELCFSADGRIICSPYDKGIRLLGFNEHVQELSYCVPEKPKELFTITEMNFYHPDVVVSCKFSPRHYQLVSGCLKGEIVWYKPFL